MLNLRQIAYASLISTNRHKVWWILALGQVAGFFLLGQTLGPDHRILPWLPLVLVLLAPVTVWLWLDMQAVKIKVIRQSSAASFLNQCLSSGAVIIFALLIIFLARLTYLHWLFVTLFFSVVAATAALAMLYIVLFNQSLFKSLLLALDTWRKKISLAAIVAFVLIIAHGFSYAFAHSLWDPDFLNSGQFSSFGHSATIWILSIGGGFVVAYLAALLNCFLVFLFLEIIRSEKEPESVLEEARARQPVFEGNN